jgi:predicted lipid-binding transport protein (Tim44 family)
MQQVRAMNQTLDPTTIILAALAIFIVWKLRSVLGTRTGTERPPFNPFARRNRADAAPTGAPETGRVIPLPGAAPATAAPAAADANRWRGSLADESPSASAGLDAIASADPTFTAQGFLGGARGAYEMIVAAFAKGDRAALKTLLSSDVYDGFTAAIAAREARGETVQHTFVALGRALIEDAHLRGGTAQIAVVFESQQINAVHGRDGALADAGSETVGHVVDHWTFARDIGSRDPNWKLVATQAE